MGENGRQQAHRNDNHLAMSYMFSGCWKSGNSHTNVGIWNRGPFIRLVTVDIVQSISGPRKLYDYVSEYITKVCHLAGPQKEKPLARNLFLINSEF